MSDVSTHDAAVEAAACAKGLVVVRPKDNELFLDIDDAISLAMFEKLIGILTQRVPCTWVMKPSPSGKPWHLPRHGDAPDGRLAAGAHRVSGLPWVGPHARVAVAAGTARRWIPGGYGVF